MADVNPYAKYAADSANPYAKYVEQPGVIEDVAKAAPVGLGKGVLAVAGTGGDLQSLAKGGSDLATAKGVNPFSWLGDKFANTQLGQFLKEETAKTMKSPIAQGVAVGGDTPGNIALPSTADLQGQVEKVTGPFYEAKTPVGKAVQTATEVAPAIAMGAPGVRAVLAKSAGAGAVSEGAGEAAKALQGKLPDAAQPWAEPVARAVGAGVGMLAPAGVRKVVTPLPMTDERLATVNALRGVNPELVNASSAGQLTERPFLMGAEARSPRMADLPARQSEAYTRGVMRQAGSNGMFDTAGLAEAKSTGAQLEALRNAHEINPVEFANLNRGVNQERRDLFRSAGESKPFDTIRDEIRGGPTGGNPVPLSMTGERYGAMRQMIRNAETGAPTTHEQTAIANVRGRMDDALHNSMPADEAARLQNLDRQYSNFKTIEGIPAPVGANTVTPQQVFSKANRGSELETHATQAADVMTPLPKPDFEGGPGTKLLGGVLGGLGGATLGHVSGGGSIGMGSEGLLGAFYGQGHVNDVLQALKNTGGRAVSRPVPQAYLKNQFWRPGQATSVDPAAIARLLMSPQVKEVVGQE